MMLFTITLVTAEPLPLCEDEQVIYSNCTMLTPTLDCTEYNWTAWNLSGGLAGNGSLRLLNSSVYYFNFTLGEGDYIIELCDHSTREIRVKEDEDRTMFAAIIILPMLLAIIFMIGAASLDAREHSPLKIFLFLLSVPLFWTSLHFATEAMAKFYNFPNLQEAIGDTTYWIAIVFVVILSYFALYLIKNAVHLAAQKKNERLNY